MDAVPIVPPLFQGTKNTTLHELQTADRSRATDMRGMPELRWFAPAIMLRVGTSGPQRIGISYADRRLGPPGRDDHDREAHARSLPDLQASETRSACITGQIRGPHLPHQGRRHQIREGQRGVVQLQRPEHAYAARVSRAYADAQGPRRAPDRTHGDDAGPDAEDDRIRLGAAVCETGGGVSRPAAARRSCRSLSRSRGTACRADAGACDGRSGRE